MIKIENMHTCNWEAAIRGMRNPMNSWDKSDSGMGCYPDCRLCRECNYKPEYCGMDNDHYVLGPNDLKLAKQLATAGSDHGKFLRMIIFSCDITAPMYWWKEMDTYKVGTVRNSCSTMHKITEKEFTIEDFSVEHLDHFSLTQLKYIIGRLNANRSEYLCWDPKDETALPKKDYWWQLIQLLPSSYNQRATWTANYEVLRNIYHARKNHKLDEWHMFCDMIEELPYSELITEKR